MTEGEGQHQCIGKWQMQWRTLRSRQLHSVIESMTFKLVLDIWGQNTGMAVFQTLVHSIVNPVVQMRCG